MIYLLAKYTLLFVLTAILGFVLGYWFSRRNIEDVTESFEDLRKANERSDSEQWNRLWLHLDAMPAPKDTDLSDVYERIDKVASAVANLPKPQPVDFHMVETQLEGLRESVDAIPPPVAPVPTDLSPVTNKLGALEQRVNSLPQPKDVDLAPVDERLSGIERELAGLGKRLAEQTRAAPAPVDLTPVTNKLSALEQRVNSLPQPKNVDLKPVDQRLNGIERELAGLGKRLAKPLPVERASRKQPVILKAALYGTKDNLQSISGVGPKLENLLNKNGVFYFWQVAEWTPNDIEIIDKRLDVFRGRIERDNWVTQAKELKQQPGAAHMPGA